MISSAEWASVRCCGRHIKRGLPIFVETLGMLMSISYGDAAMNCLNRIIVAKAHCKTKENLMFGLYRFVFFKNVGAGRANPIGQMATNFYMFACILCTLFLVQPALSESQKTIVHNSKELSSFLASAQGGEMIYLDPTEQTVELKLDGINSPKTPVTIKPLKPGANFNISYLKLTKSSNLIFEGLPFSMQRKGAVATGPSNIEITGSQNITFSNCIMKGTATGYISITDINNRSANLSLIRESDGITFTNNDISSYFQGFQFLEVKHITVTGNEIQKIQGDGLRMGGVVDVVISGNSFHDFLGSDQIANHSDMIQLWSTNAVIVSHNILISDNTLNSGEGSATQSIFMRNEQADQPASHDDQFYNNITIENNLIYNGHSHGITVGETNGLTIANNTLLQNPRSTMGNGAKRISWAPGIHIAKRALAVKINNNVTRVVDAGPDANIYGNLIVDYSSSNQPNSVDQLYIGARYGGQLPPIALHVLPRGLADVRGLGSTLTKREISDWNESVFFRARELGEKPGNMGFEVQKLPSAKGSPEQINAGYAWDFGDGATAIGKTVQHAFPTPGRFKITLRIMGPSGSTGQYWNYITVPEPLLFRMQDNGTEIVDASSYHSGVKSKLQTSQLGPISGLPTLTLSKDSYIEIGRGESQFFDLQKFGMSFFFKCDAVCQAGTVVMIHKSFDLQMTEAREIQFHLIDSIGQNVALRSGRTRVADNKWHHFVLNYDAPAGNAKLYIDGVLISKTAATAATRPMQSWGLALGNQFNNSVQGIFAGFEFSRFPYEPDQIAEQFKLLPK
jgi:hypothetical protein